MDSEKQGNGFAAAVAFFLGGLFGAACNLGDTGSHFLDRGSHRFDILRPLLGHAVELMRGAPGDHEPDSGGGGA